VALTIGARLGVYEITGSLDAGGMGEVYRAKDMKLGRDIAIETVLSGLAEDTERLALNGSTDGCAAAPAPIPAQLESLPGTAHSETASTQPARRAPLSPSQHRASC
jgi:hypothetical protein